MMPVSAYHAVVQPRHAINSFAIESISPGASSPASEKQDCHATGGRAAQSLIRPHIDSALPR